jgi:hypothetical protein
LGILGAMRADAAVRSGWTFLGELAQRPMFTAQQRGERSGVR